MSKKAVKFVGLALALCSVFGAFGINTLAASANERTKEIAVDNFNDVNVVGSYDSSIWTAYTQEENVVQVKELTAPTNMFRVGGTLANECEQALYSAKKFTNLKEITFDMYYGTNKWCALQFPTEEPNTANDLNPYMSIFGPENFMNGYSWVSVKIKAYTNDYAKMFVVPLGAEWPDEEQPTKELSDMNFSECYFAMFFNHSEAREGHFYLDNFKFLEEDGTVTEENFETEADITKTQMRSVVKDGKVADHKIEMVAGVNKLAFTEAKVNDGILLNQEISKNDQYVASTSLVVDTAFELTINDDADKIAYTFGQSEQSGEVLKNVYAVELSTTTAEIVRYNENGEKSLLQTMTYPSIKNVATTVSISVAKNGVITVKVGENSVAGENIAVWFGYTGFVALNDLVEEIYLDDVSVSSAYYKVPVSKSVTTNFSSDYNISAYNGEKTDGDFIYRPESGSMEVKDGELVWTHISDGGYFSANYEYDSFILDFKLTSILYNEKDMSGAESTPCHKWLGLDIGQKSNSGKLGQYGSNATIVIRITNESSAPDEKTPDATWDYASIGMYKSLDSESQAVGTENAKLPASFFKAITYDNAAKKRADIKAEDAVCFRFVAQNNSVEVYAKKASDSEYVKYYTLSNVDTAGYSSLCCTGYTFLSLDDFAMVNTAPIYALPDTKVPETDAAEKEEVVIYDRGNVDVNWQDELDLNKNDGMSFGCSGNIGALSAILPCLIGIGAIVFKRKKD